MKKPIRKVLTAFALAVGVTTANAAATPNAAWYFFTPINLTQGTGDSQYSLTLGENTKVLSDGSILCGADTNPITLTIPTARNKITIQVEVSDLPETCGFFKGEFSGTTGTTTDYGSVERTATGTLKQRYGGNDNDYGTYSSFADPAAGEHTFITVSFEQNSGVRTYWSGKGDATPVMNNGSLKKSSGYVAMAKYYIGFVKGGTGSSGMKVHGIKVYDNAKLTDDADVSAEYARTFTGVVAPTLAWRGDFGTAKGGNEINLNGNELGEDGWVTIGSEATKGVTIDSAVSQLNAGTGFTIVSHVKDIPDAAGALMAFAESAGSDKHDIQIRKAATAGGKAVFTPYYDASSTSNWGNVPTAVDVTGEKGAVHYHRSAQNTTGTGALLGGTFIETTNNGLRWNNFNTVSSVGIGSRSNAGEQCLKGMKVGSLFAFNTIVNDDNKCLWSLATVSGLQNTRHVTLGAATTVGASVTPLTVAANSAAALTFEPGATITTVGGFFANKEVTVNAPDVEYGQVIISGPIYGAENIKAGSLPAGLELVKYDSQIVVGIQPANFTAEIATSKNLSAVTWAPPKMRDFCDADTITVTNAAAGTTFTIDESVTVSRMSFVSVAGNSLALDRTDGPTVAVGEYDFTQAQGGVTLGFTPEGTVACASGAPVRFNAAYEGAPLVKTAGATTSYKSAALTLNSNEALGGLNLKVENGDAVTVDSTSLRPTFSVDISGGTLTFDPDGNLATIWCGENGTTTFAQSGGEVRFNANGQGQSGSGSGVILGYTGTGATPLVLNISGGLFAAENTSLNLWNAVDMNVAGGTVRVKGVFAGAGSAHTIDVEPGATFELGSLGWRAGSSTFTLNGGTLKAYENATMEDAIAFADGAKLVAAAGKTLLVKGAVTGEGTLTCGDSPDSGNVVFMGVEPPAGVAGTYYYGYTVTVNDCGKFALPAGREPEKVKLYDLAGNEVAATYNQTTGEFEFEWGIEGGNCWWDYEFNGNLKSVGTDTAEMTNERSKDVEDPFNEAKTALRVGYGTPWRNVGDYPEEFSAVIYGKIVDNTNHLEIGFGSTTTKGTGADANYGVVIACGDPLQNEVRLLVTSGYGVIETVSMKVPNAYDARHLYAFTCQTVEGNTRVSVYLDGKLLQAKTFEGKVILGKGFQIGSIHGGSLSGYIKATTANENAELDFLRVYKTVLNDEAMAKYAEKYKYVSENGESVRTFAGAEDWTAAEGTPWAVTPFDQPTVRTAGALAGSIVEIGASAASVVTMNLGEATQYEALTVEDGAEIAIAAGEGAVAPTVTGLSTFDADVTIDCDAIKFGNVEVAAEKTLTFDFTDFPFDTYFANATIAYTGNATGEGEITAVGLPGTGARTATFEKNASTSQYELKIAVDATVPFVYDNGGWTFDGETVTEETVDANPGVAIHKNGAGTLEKALANNRSYVVNGGTFKATGAVNIHAAVTVNEGAAFDFNGSVDGYVTVNLNGGTLVNNGGNMGVNNRQIEGIALAADSAIGGTGLFGMSSDAHHANVIDLGGFVLTKEDGNIFFLLNTTVTNGAFEVDGGTLRIAGATTFAADATLTVGAGGTLAVDNGQTLSIGEVTLEDGAKANVGTNRGLTFGGAGTVDVELTQAEFEAGTATVFTPAEGATTKIGTVTYGGKSYMVKAADGRITRIFKKATLFLVK